MLSGCAFQDNDSENTNQIVVWHWLSDRIDVFGQLASEYKELTGIDVKFELYAPTAAYTGKIRSAAQANKLPDIYGGFLFENRDVASFIKAGHIYDLSSYMNADNGKWKNIFYKKGLSLNSFADDNQYGIKSGIYGVPIDINNIQMVYNIKLLEQVGWVDKVPLTWDEFMQLAKDLKTNNISGFVGGWGETWLLHCLADNFAWNIMGEQKVKDTITGKVPYTDADWVKVFTLFEEMVNSDMFFPGSVTMVNKEAEQMFANERAAVAFNGSWCVNVYGSMNPDLEYKGVLPPKVNLNNSMYIWGGCTSFVVNASSAKKEEAVEFLRWLTQEKQQRFMSGETNNIPANKKCADVLQGNIKDFANDIDNIVHPRFMPTEEFPLVNEAFDKGLQLIMIKESTAQEVAQRVQDTKVNEIKKAERFRKIREKRKAVQK